MSIIADPEEEDEDLFENLLEEEEMVGRGSDRHRHQQFLCLNKGERMTRSDWRDIAKKKTEVDEYDHEKFWNGITSEDGIPSQYRGAIWCIFLDIETVTQ